MTLAQKSLIGLHRYAKCLYILALAACACTRTPENCGDGGDTLDPGKQFCRDGAAWSKCGGKEYDPYAKFCSAEKTHDKCGGKDVYDPLREFCYANKVVLKCGGGGDGGTTYNPETQGCYSGIVKERCGNNLYDPHNEFCFNNVRIYNLCNGNAFDPTKEGCAGEAVRPKCGTDHYNAETQFCYNNAIYPKCNGNDYDPANNFCSGGATYAKCGGKDYDPSKQTCNGTTIADIVGPPKCDGVEYDGATSFCYNNTAIIPKCGGAAYDTSTHTCNGTTVVAKIILPKCNGTEYDSTINFCYNNTVIPKCGGQTYNPALKMCNANNIIDIPPQTKYTVYFNTNGGTDGANPPTAIETEAGKNITLPGQQTMGKTGYSFGGWNTNNLGSGTGYKAGDSYTVTATTNLYAKWIPIYTVTFNGNNATSGDPREPMTADSGTNITLPSKGTLARTGYSFGGWNTAGVGGINYRADSSYTVTGNATLYARWIPIYTVTFNGNGATGGVPDTVKVDSGTVITLPGQGSMIRANYAFGGGWSTTSSGSGGTNYNVGDFYTVTGNATLYARWTPIYTVTFNGNNATAGSAPVAVSVESGTAITLPGQGSMARTNYSFGGWSTSSTGGTNYPAGSSYTVTGNVILHARWTAYPVYTITYNGNGATSGVPAAVQVDSGSSITISTMTRTNYHFNGWNTNSGGTGTNYAVGASYTIMGNVTLYAKWTAYPVYTITYNGNGMTSGVPVSMDADSNSTITLPAMARIYYTLGGWNTNNTGTGTNYNIGSSYTVTNNVTLYASWTLKGTQGTSLSYGGQTYRTVIMPDGKTWMAENLNYATSSGSWCYDNNNSNCNTYGRLYDWNTAMTVCPSGWHLPSSAEWTIMDNYVGNYLTSNGTKLKSTSGWYNHGNGTDEYGFSALPGGYRDSDGSFNVVGAYGSWWTATEGRSSYAYYKAIYSDDGYVITSDFAKSDGHSVRCVRDN